MDLLGFNLISIFFFFKNLYTTVTPYLYMKEYSTISLMEKIIIIEKINILDYWAKVNEFIKLSH